jgi:GNAT superfamily N-acetyltransferase
LVVLTTNCHNVPMVFRVVPFVEDEHREGAVAALLRVRKADPSYPPPQDADPTYESLSSWLQNEPVLARWVAVLNGSVTGHVQVSAAHKYLLDHLATDLARCRPFAEIGKLFVAPDTQNVGIGTALLYRACEFAVSQGMRPALAVLPTSVAAIRLYRRSGMECAGTFIGVHGENLVMLGPANV